MLDKFTKSKVEPPLKAQASRSDRLPGLEDAWRIAYAIDNALKAAETEKRALSDRVEDATAWAAVSLGTATTNISSARSSTRFISIASMPRSATAANM
jgi:hypothetical protein